MALGENVIRSLGPERGTNPAVARLAAQLAAIGGEKQHGRECGDLELGLHRLVRGADSRRLRMLTQKIKLDQDHVRLRPRRENR